MSTHESVAGEPVRSDDAASAVDETPFAVSTSLDGTGARVVARGEVDISTASRLRVELADAMNAASGVVIDLTEVTFMDSHGLRVLIEALVASEERSFVVSAASPNVRRLIRVSGLEEPFGLVPADR